MSCSKQERNQLIGIGIISLSMIVFLVVGMGSAIFFKEMTTQIVLILLPIVLIACGFGIWLDVSNSIPKQNHRVLRLIQKEK